MEWGMVVDECLKSAPAWVIMVGEIVSSILYASLFVGFIGWIITNSIELLEIRSLFKKRVHEEPEQEQEVECSSKAKNMDYMWRIAKYNPAYRTEEGLYLLDDWTSFYGIGEEYGGIKLTLDIYEKYEQMYIDAILLLMKSNGVDNLKVVDLEQYEDIDLVGIEDGMLLDKEQIKVVVKNILRDKCWCKLEHEGSFYVHFGYAYIMYIGGKNSCEGAIKEIQCNNMYVEYCESPYV